MTEETPAPKASWLSRLRDGLKRSTTKLTEGIESILTKRKLDEKALADLEEVLIAADLGPLTAAKIVKAFGKTRFGKEVSDEEVKQALADEITKILEPCAKPLDIDRAKRPFVLLFVGVNGTGKTTTIGKMAHFYTSQGFKVKLVAGDTFRAAAVAQLQVWGHRAGVPVVSGAAGADAAGLIFRAVEESEKDGTDLLLVDTAGRLQNKTGLMEELAKIIRVMKKRAPEAPHGTLLVLDATTGQNAHMQVEIFRDLTHVTGLIVTKLDGSAKGGVLVSLADRFGVPIHAIGVGEGADDLRPFDAEDFARSLMGLDDQNILT